ncbi:3-hydroxyacyl-CoA dehydrogenase/enoyl-CoA hydratase family protein [Microvirga guangxiensis]|uniref:3-hydroxyacyl-CoA dehydrogenase n=1 Tax=Microvirga guangxiensis TaxID=549386 RepID=A0A1G5I5D3_9HYPH|nr:3-hydroxyacyl-CoA dehydrogenase/enoyl-CoA hydratase family protein [Microvirga guangxiensis]SCY71257.1 3-hydroxyacyl-CoA dehydrogenase [Microvirga guangxiensis]
MNQPLHFPSAVEFPKAGIKRAAVIGAGSMGSGIAAQFANAGILVDLLDIRGEASSPNAPAEAGIARQLRANGFMHPDAAKLVRPGNIDDDLQRLSEVDWIVEAVIEKLDIKRDLYRRIASIKKAGAILSSNTSTIPRADLIAELDSSFAGEFLITHFFNPPRIMRLVEIVSSPENSPELVARAKTGSEWILGKTVVDCHDTPGFIANRIGCYWLAVAALEAKSLGLTIEEADMVMAALGVPRTGAFGLLDLIGIDLIPHVWGSLMTALPASDDIHTYDLPSDRTVQGMIAAGQLGRKAKSGFYRVNADKSRDVLDLSSGLYRTEQRVDMAALPGKGKDLSALLQSEDRLGVYAWRVLSRLIVYAAEVGPEVANDVAAIDTAMELGYAWREGPFKLAERCGLENIVERLKQDGIGAPPLLTSATQAGGFYDKATGLALRTDGTRAQASGKSDVLTLSAVKRKRPRIMGNEGASLWDAGDGIACLESHTKMNSLTPAVFDALEQSLAKCASDFRALVIVNDDQRAFSAGADLSYFVDLVRKEDWSGLSAFLVRGQQLFLQMKYAPFPVVAGVAGLTLGGGCELMLHCDGIVAHAELAAGLPETKVGIVPGWGGCTQLLLRAQERLGNEADPAATSQLAFDTILAGHPSSSALDAWDKGLLRSQDEIVMNRAHLFDVTVQRAASLASSGYSIPQRARVVLAGSDGKQALMGPAEKRKEELGLSATDMRLAETLASVLTGAGLSKNEVSEEDMMALERDAVIALAKMPETRERIEHMLSTGKPLRN